ncbi:MAG: class I SAM-dependent methyltransferase [Verrucomicrobiales bacterium]|nr:class I SAM-dependent methyltransferase [Verrucomicrobiales bacterium]
MGLRSKWFRNSGEARRLEDTLARAKAAQARLKQRVDELKARPPRRPLDSQPELERSLSAALDAAAADADWTARVPGWPTFRSAVSSAISSEDIMLVKSTAPHYVGVGLSALECMNQCLAAAQAPAPRRVLDFGCGYGRVLRFARAAWPEAEIYATDMDAEGLGFCVHHLRCFGVATDLDHGPDWVSARFDLIWVGSVFTHLSVADSQRLMAHLAAFLAPGGLVVFTTHGENALDRMRAHSEGYRLESAVLDQIVSDCEKTGHGYADYPNWPGYGVSASQTVWVQELARAAGLTCITHLPAGWDAHQDVFAARKG